MNNEHYGIYLIILLDYICTSKDYKFNFNLNYEEYPLKIYVLKASKHHKGIYYNIYPNESYSICIVLKLFV